MKKTHAIKDLPPPILMLDFEGGSASVLPWIARRRDSDETGWTTYSQEQRDHFMELVKEVHRASVTIKPSPYIDLVHFDNLRYDSYNEFVELLGNLDTSYYSSVALDSLQEFAIDTQTFAKGRGRELTEMELKLWAGAQERAAIALRRLRNLRDSGVFTYLTGSEEISKDYVKDPREKRAGEAVPEPYNIRGTVNLPGKLAGGLAHLPDILMHARMLNGRVVWVTTPESLPGGYAYWDAKDRYGRLETFEAPNLRTLFDKLYGQTERKEIYGAGVNHPSTVGVS